MVIHALCQAVFPIFTQVHVSSSSPVASHCSVFALSDTEDSDLRQQCKHNHEKLYDQCESLHSTLNDISTAVDEASFTTEEDKDEALFLVSSATLAIQSWKCHLLRSTHQDQARLDVIDALNSGTVFIVNDWAMKFLPQRYRESQTDCFGKRGISWHICSIQTDRGCATVASLYPCDSVLYPRKFCCYRDYATCSSHIEARVS